MYRSANFLSSRLPHRTCTSEHIMLVNKHLEDSATTTLAVNAKWLHFSCFTRDGEQLEAGDERISRCFEQLNQHDENNLLFVMREAVHIGNRDDVPQLDVPYKKTKVVDFTGPAVVGLDGKGITFKDASIYAIVEYKERTENAYEHDILDCLDIELCLEDLRVRLTGAYDYSIETLR